MTEKGLKKCSPEKMLPKNGKNMQLGAELPGIAY